MRTCSAGLEAAIATECTTLARLWRVTRTDGTVLRFTDSTRPITYSGDVYRSDISFTCSAIFTSSNFQNAQNVSFRVMMDDNGVKEDDLRARKYDGAKGEVFVINYEVPTDGIMTLFVGTFGRVKICDKLVAEVELTPQGQAQAGRTLAGEVFSATCRNSLGDSVCLVDLEALKVAFTVATVDGSTFTAAALTQADEYWTQGFVQWLTGDNVGPKVMVGSFTQSSNTIRLAAATPKPIVVGNTGYVFPGCDKLITTCRDKFNNLARNRSEPTVPAGDLIPSYLPLAPAAAR